MAARRERLEVELREAALACPGAAFLGELGPCERQRRRAGGCATSRAGTRGSRAGRRPPTAGPRRRGSSAPASASRSKRIRQAEKRFSSSPDAPSSSPRRCASRGSTHARSSASRMYSDSASLSLSRAELGWLVLGDAAAHAHHLGQRPVGDAFAVGEAAAAVPEDVRREAVDVLLELPGEPRLADAGDAAHEHELRAPLLGAGMEELLHEPKLAVAADERRLQPRRAQRTAGPGHDPQRPPQLHRLGLALELVHAGVLVGDRRLGRALRRLADEHGARLGGRLDARGGVDGVAGDHALRARAERDGRLAGEHAGPRAQVGVELGDRREQLERGADGALGVVLLGHRRAPDGHDGVADELLDRAAVALDHAAGSSRSSATAARASPRRRVAPTRAVKPTRSAKSTETSRRSAWGAEAAAGCRGGGDGEAVSAAPHSAQNLLSGA